MRERSEVGVFISIGWGGELRKEQRKERRAFNYSSCTRNLLLPAHIVHGLCLFGSLERERERREERERAKHVLKRS